MIEGLVSIITPCYNKGEVISRFLDSIIMQSYSPIELIVVNDGSTDESIAILNNYRQHMKNAGIEYQIITKENGGLGAAIDTGLKYVNGEYLCWPDIDDWYSPDAIELRVEYLKNHPYYGSVTCNAYIYHESNVEKNIGKITSGNKNDYKENQFLLMLKGRTIFCPGCHLVRTECLFDVLNDKSIYPSRHGQNVQLLLPLYYKYRRGFLNIPLYHYVIYENSMSHRVKEFREYLAMRKGRYDIKIRTIESIKGMSKRDQIKYKCIVNASEARSRLRLAISFRKKRYGSKMFKKLVRLHAVTPKDCLDYASLIISQ